MNIFYAISNFFALLVTLIAMIFAFTWKTRKGKWLLCTSLILSLIAAFQFVALTLFLRWSPLDYSMTLFKCFNILGIILNQAANILLLCFVIVARKPTPTIPMVPIRSDFDTPAGDTN